MRRVIWALISLPVIAMFRANQLALASASGALATATASSNQAAYGNYTSNKRSEIPLSTRVDVALAATDPEPTTGTSDQVGDVYLDTWDSSSDSPWRSQHWPY